MFIYFLLYCYAPFCFIVVVSLLYWRIFVFLILSHVLLVLRCLLLHRYVVLCYVLLLRYHTLHYVLFYCYIIVSKSICCIVTVLCHALLPCYIMVYYVVLHCYVIVLHRFIVMSRYIVACLLFLLNFLDQCFIVNLILFFSFFSLQRSIRPQVVTTFELPGCHDMWTVISNEEKPEQVKWACGEENNHN